MDVTLLIDTYCRAWSDPDKAERTRILQQVWAANAIYIDPTVRAVGVEELLEHIARVVAKRPGSRVIRTSQIDQHHGLARFAWRVIEADGTKLPEGIDIAFISTDGTKIDKILGFFGSLRQLAENEYVKPSA